MQTKNFRYLNQHGFNVGYCCVQSFQLSKRNHKKKSKRKRQAINYKYFYYAY